MPGRGTGPGRGLDPQEGPAGGSPSVILGIDVSIPPSPFPSEIK